MKRFIATILIVFILALSVNDCYFVPDDTFIPEVDAAEIAITGLATSAMYAISLYFGTVALGCIPQSMSALSQDSIAELGHRVLNSLTLPSSAQQALSILDSDGQSYVVGTGALKEIGDTDWNVIQGGKNDNGGNNNMHWNDVEHAAIAMSKVVALTAINLIKEHVIKFFNKEESVFDDVDYGFSNQPEQLIVEEQVGLFTPKARIVRQIDNTSVFVYLNHDFYSPRDNKIITIPNDYIATVDTSSRKVFAVQDGLGFALYLYDFTVHNHQGYSRFYKGGQYSYDSSTGIYTWATKNISNNSGYSSGISYPDVVAYNVNFPVFATYEDGVAWAESGGNYRIADWLQDDWAGELIDPLTGFNRLSDLFNLIAHNGLNALGDLDTFKQWLRDFFENLKNTVTPPVYNPVAPPVVYPVDTPITNPVPGDGEITIPWDPVNPDDPNPTPDPEPVEDVIPGLDVAIPDLSDLLKTKFPFCIPWDLYAVLQSFTADSLIPHYEIPVHFTFFGVSYHETLIIDLALFNRLARFCRSLITILYLVGLMLFSVEHFGKDM